MVITSAYKYKIILASGSPRRQQLLRDMGLTFAVRSLDADESFPPEKRGADIARYLCEKKARAYPDKLADRELLITADTIVWVDDTVLNKPESEFEAKQMLRLLSGKMHQVFTGVCLQTAEAMHSFTDETKVWFKELSDEEIQHYIRIYKPFDKAGSYGAQDWLGLIGVNRIDGSYFNVMGLPVHRLYEELGKL